MNIVIKILLSMAPLTAAAGAFLMAEDARVAFAAGLITAVICLFVSSARFKPSAPPEAALPNFPENFLPDPGVQAKEMDVRQLRARYRTLLGCLPWGFITVDREGLIKEANAKARSLLKLPPESKNLKQSEILRRSEEIDGILDISGNQKQTLEIPLPSEDGSGESPGDLLLFVRSCWPDTQSRAIIVESTVEAPKPAADHGRGYGMSQSTGHRLNNILAAILGYLELASGENRPDLQERYQKAAIDAVGSARELVRRSLDPGSGANAARSQRLVELITESVHLLRVNKPLNLHLDVEVDAAADYPPVLVDPYKVHKAVTVLYYQLAHHLGEKGGHISIDIQRLPHESPTGVHFQSIRLRGLGVAINDPNPNFHLINVVDGLEEMMIVPDLLRDGQGGRLLSLDASRGGELSVELYFVESVTPDSKILQAEADPSAAVRPDEPSLPLRILFVDDEQSLAEIGQKSLMRLGHTVTKALNGPDALAAFKSKDGEFDLVITDQTMPNMTGLELAEALQVIKPGLPIILCTGFVSQTLLRQARELGLRHVIQKPLNLRELTALLKA